MTCCWCRVWDDGNELLFSDHLEEQVCVCVCVHVCVRGCMCVHMCASTSSPSHTLSQSDIGSITGTNVTIVGTEDEYFRWW